MGRKKDMYGDVKIGGEVPQGNEIKTKGFYLDEHFICDGNVKVCRTIHSGKNYQMIMWIRGEKKHFRQSLRETDLENAKKKATEIYIKIMGSIYRGEKIFTMKVGELVEGYLNYQKVRVKDKLITQGRWSGIRSTLKHLMNFVGEDTRLDTIEGKRYKHYYAYRRKNNPEVQNITLKNERSQISHMYRWGFDEGYINRSKTPIWNELKFSKPKSRNYIDRDNYRKLYSYINNWEKDSNEEKEIYHRKLVRDFIFVLANTGLRFGECRQLKWSYIKLLKSKNSKYPNVKIKVPEHITKTRRERYAVGMRGDIFTRIKKYAKYKDGDDFIFANFKENKPFDRKLFYTYWDKIMVQTGLDKSPLDFSYYSLRHTFISYRLMYGDVNVFTLSEMVGTGIKYIQDHYGHLKIEDIADDFTKVVNKPNNQSELDEMFGGGEKFPNATSG